MSTLMWLIIGSGLLAIVYGVWAARSIMAADAGNERMQKLHRPFKRAQAPI